MISRFSQIGTERAYALIMDEKAQDPTQINSWLIFDHIQKTYVQDYRMQFRKNSMDSNCFVFFW